MQCHDKCLYGIKLKLNLKPAVGPKCLLLPSGVSPNIFPLFPVTVVVPPVSLSCFLGGLFSKTEMSEVLTEILKVDPSFDKDRFLKQCEFDIIPNVLESMMSGELDILKDWCYEATYSQLAHPIQQAKAMGLQFHSRILDIDNIDLAMGKMMEQGPVLIITFQAQVVLVIKNQKGEVVEGDPDKVLRMLYVWALCRDQDELNPYAAWRLLDISSSSTEQVL